MKRLVIAVLAVLVLLFGMRTMFGTARFGGANVIYSLENSFFVPLSFTTGLPGPVLWIGSIVLVALLIRWIFGARRQTETGRCDRRDTPSPAPSDNTEVVELVHELHRTARNLEKRLESLETILLDRTHTSL
ncbi:MAG: hypothetical protein L3K26_19160 [Candidatus Hydrogenedentes bacterium]|nr:hypothetical protein [Candidatus Hydrogenedentota bacterium]